MTRAETLLAAVAGLCVGFLAGQQTMNAVWREQMEQTRKRMQRAQRRNAMGGHR